MPQIFRLGCAGVAMIVIAALTSVGLYAVVAGGVPWGGSNARSTSNAATVLVTIQAAPVTPTVLPTATSTPGSLLPLVGASGPAIVPPSAAPSAVDSRPAGTPVASAASMPPASPPVPVSTPADPAAGRIELGRQAAHEGITLEIVELDRGWQATSSDGSPVRQKPGFELLTVHVKLTNDAADVRYVSDADLLLVGEDGSRYVPRQAPPLRGPHLLTLPVLPNDVVRGWLTYEVPVGLDLRRLQWSPTRPDRPRAEKTYLLTLPR